MTQGKSQSCTVPQFPHVSHEAKSTALLYSGGYENNYIKDREVLQEEGDRGCIKTIDRPA